jgi:hypothetical protein
LSNRRFAFLDRYLFAALVIGAVAVILACQFRMPFSVAVGGPIDGPLLSSFHDPEVDNSTGTRFRWTTGASEFVVRDWGGGNPVDLHVRVSRWQPNGGIADLTIYVNGVELAEPQASGQGWQEYSLPITDDKFLSSDDLRVKFESDTFVPKEELPGSKDPRRLGIQISSIKLNPLQSQGAVWRPAAGLVWSPTRTPPLDLALYFIASALALYVGAAALKFPSQVAFLVSVLFSICTAMALVWARPYITIFAETFFVILVVSIGLGLLARAIVPRFFVWGGVRARGWEFNTLSAIFAFAFLIKMAMLLYPQTISFDLLYHAHRLMGVMTGNLFWSIPSGKNEFGGQAVPYSPSLYLFLTPFARFVPPELLIQLSGVLLDNLSIFLIYYLVVKYFPSLLSGTSRPLDAAESKVSAPRAGIIAAWIYVVAPLSFIALSWGIYANLYGQTLTLVLVVTLVEAFDKLTRLKAFFIVALLFTMTLLSHTSVFASVVPLFAAWAALIFLFGRMWRARQYWALIGSIVVASVLAFAIYYSVFLGLVTQGTLQIANAAADPNTRNVSGETLTVLQLLQPARTPYTAVPLYIYLAALLGFVLLLYGAWRFPTRGRFLLATMVLAWVAAFALLVLVRAEFGFSARYVNFAMPAIALCAGMALAWVYARGLLGRIASFGLITLLTAEGLYNWYILVMYQYH